ncbi:NAD(P)-dependent dehydrogenase (short-subunit alcohol dehydrogenase family) [Streptosporangium album]|uniref:NAD(P)-dependent dehydrogenase (Short-subunit alcohol dehydrogenase family) n=1 Tax=Streptosporangium album TaxID=47479 RepID=A0A7W7S655_9ACTN|nr:SDR family oxidoreductase [Streptosporangium album]MBB4944182.1 NAD(P)-dependent dehydrogenase (short-subunit alcohol dehydrogenase family) [Streptosporangium album]
MSATSLLTGKTVLVSGVGPGLGRQIAGAACAAGASVMLGARSRDYLEEATAELRTASGKASFRVCDVTSDEQCHAVVQAVEEEFGGLDCVVNNAFAVAPHGLTLENEDLDEWRQSFEVNFFGALGLTKAAIPALRRSGGGTVVFIGSQIVRRVFAGRGPYASSKAALLTASRVLAKEVGPYGIRVNTVVPGRMWGPSLRKYLDRLAVERGTSAETERQRMVADVALPSLVTDEQCAGTVVFLASDLSAGITGQTIDVNAGETLN